VSNRPHYLADIPLAEKRVLIREDLNVPIKDGVITSDARIRAALPGIRLARDGGAAVIVMSHLGRPTEGQPDPALSLAPVAERLSELLGQPVHLVTDWSAGVEVVPGQVVLLENVRFNVGEKKDAEDLARAYAALCASSVRRSFAAG